MDHPEFPVVSLLSCALLLTIVPIACKLRCIPVTFLVGWLLVMHLIATVNAFLWSHSVDIKARVWCDITTKVDVGFGYAWPASILCSLRYLDACRTGIVSKTTARHAWIFDALMCTAMPLVFMALHYIVQGHRFDIMEDFGCYPTTYFSIPAIFIIWVPQICLYLAGGVYAAMIIRRRHLVHPGSQSSLSEKRVIRLIAFTMTQLVWGLVATIEALGWNASSGLRQWSSWNNVHSHFSRIFVLPQSSISTSSMRQLLFQWWTIPIASFLLFIFIGTGEDALEDHRDSYEWFCQHVLRRNSKSDSAIGWEATLPTHPRKLTISLNSSAQHANEVKHGDSAYKSVALAQMGDKMRYPSGRFSLDSTSSESPSPVLDISTKRAQGSKDDNELQVVAIDDYMRRTRNLNAKFSESLPELPTTVSPPTVTITPSTPLPESSFPNSSSISISSSIPPVPPLPRPAHIRQGSNPSSIRWSTSTEVDVEGNIIGISISPVCYPNPANASRYHEEAMLTPSSEGEPKPYSHEGERARLEKPLPSQRRSWRR